MQTFTLPLGSSRLAHQCSALTSRTSQASCSSLPPGVSSPPENSSDEQVISILEKRSRSRSHRQQYRKVSTSPQAKERRPAGAELPNAQDLATRACSERTEAATAEPDAGPASLDATASRNPRPQAGQHWLPSPPDFNGKSVRATYNAIALAFVGDAIWEVGGQPIEEFCDVSGRPCDVSQGFAPWQAIAMIESGNTLRFLALPDLSRLPHGGADVHAAEVPLPADAAHDLLQQRQGKRMRGDAGAPALRRDMASTS